MLDKDYTLLVGTYSDMDALAHQPHAPVPGKGIYTLSLGSNGQLTEQASIESLNPAVLIPHPDGRQIYAIQETIRENGTVERFEVSTEGSLTRLDSFEANGRSTCYLALSPLRDAAIVISYWDAIIDVCAVDANGRLGTIHQSFKQFHRPEAEWRQVTDREDHWGNRQVGPHSHCAHFWRDWVFVPDLGENAVFQYAYDAQGKSLIPQMHVAFEPGSGPRHMEMHPRLDICYVSNELINTVCVARLDGSEPDRLKPRLIPCQYVATVDDMQQESYVSEIKLSPDARFLYVSNRGDNSLAIFRVLDDGRLERSGLVSTGGKFPRHFAITPCGKGVLAANQDSGTIRFFERNVDTGDLSMTDQECVLPAPCYLRFVNL